jgi:hypothetical protein
MTSLSPLRARILEDLYRDRIFSRRIDFGRLHAVNENGAVDVLA